MQHPCDIISTHTPSAPSTEQHSPSVAQPLWASHLPVHPQLPDAPSLTLGPGTPSIHSFPRSRHPILDTPTRVRQRLRSHREMAERGFNRGRTRCGDQTQTSDRQTYWLARIHTRPAPSYLSLLSAPHFADPCPLPLQATLSADTVPLTPSDILDPHIYILISCKDLLCVQFLANPSVSVSDQAGFLFLPLFVYQVCARFICIPGLCLRIFYCFPLSLASYLTRSSIRSSYCNKYFHTPH